MIMHIMNMNIKEDAVAVMTIITIIIMVTIMITITATTIITTMKEDVAVTTITTTSIMITAMSIFMWIRMILLSNIVMIQPIPKDVGLGNMIMRWDNEESLS